MNVLGLGWSSSALFLFLFLGLGLPLVAMSQRDGGMRGYAGLRLIRSMLHRPVAVVSRPDSCLQTK